jgi:SAM-dependent methyltransferase
MPATLPALYRLPAIRALLADEAVQMHRELAGTAGRWGLLLSAHDQDVLPPTPMLDRWMRLRAGGALIHGDVQARADEPLPFADDAFRVVVLSHALEVVSHPYSMLDEAVRVLAPGGLLAVTGFHPVSLWTPWLWWHGRQEADVALTWPGTWSHRLSGHGMDPYALRRIGGLAPWRAATGARSGAARGAFLLLAGKRRAAVTPIRFPPVRARPVVPASWAPGARRECA